jgi:hypothetical protein
MSLVRIAAWGMLVALMACAPSETPDPQDDAPCGVRVCDFEDPEDFDPTFEEPSPQGKADASDRVSAAVHNATQDGVLDVADLDSLFEASGNTVSRGEIAVIREALFGEDLPYLVEAEAAERGRFLARTANLSEAEASYAELDLTYAMSDTPEAVADLLVKARLHGAVAYDVNEVDDDGERVWTPYPATTPAEGNMAFDHTEITPEKLLADLEDDEVEYQAIVGTEEITLSDGSTARQARYEDRRGGTGNIFAHYDEVFHPNIFARGARGQKWANNFAILSDGSVHCLPASRRSHLQDVILTNPHLSRGVRMMYNGHLDVREGVVVGVEMSGRLSKLAAKGKANFIDPIAVLKAWGFEISDGVEVRYGNTRHGIPTRDLENGIITQDETPSND